MDTPVKVINNITETVKDDLVMTLKKGSKVSVAAACFSMYAYKELKKQMEGVDEFRFIFTAPTFTTEKATKEKREFYIPRLNRESSLYGTEFEIKLRNEMTQKAIARECAEWIKSNDFYSKLHWPGRKLQLPEPGDGEYAGAASGGGEGRSCLRRVQRKLSRYW